MLKKILITLVIIALLVAGGVHYSYKKFEAKFEAIMFAEIEKKRDEAEKAIAEKLALQVIEKEYEEESVVEPIENVVVEETNAEETNAEENTEDETTEHTIETDTTTEEADTTTEETDEVVVTPVKEVEKETEPEKVEEEVKPEKVPKKIVEEVEVVVEPDPVKVVYTEDDFERDKKIALDLAMSRLTASQLSKLIDLSDDGFTSEEKVVAKEMFYSNFSQEEQDWILGIYDKYYDLVNEV